MKCLLIILFFVSLSLSKASAQCDSSRPVPKWYYVSWNDAAYMGLFASVFAVKGMRDELTSHPDKFFENHPGLEGKPFWTDNQTPIGPMNMQWNYEHLSMAYMLKGLTIGMVFKAGDLKKYGKHWWKKAIFDFEKMDLSSRAAFYLLYNVVNKNPLFRP